MTKGIVQVSIYALSIVIHGVIAMLIWNWIMPITFELPQITVYQAIGLNLLVTTLISTGISTKVTTSNK